MSLNKKRVFITVISIVGIVLLIAYFSRGKTDPVSNTVNYIITPVQSKLSNIFVPVKNLTKYISESKKYKEENQQLKEENIRLETKIKDISEYREENERLRKLLGISEDLYNYTTVAARVVSYEPDNWFSYVTLDKGKSSGIEISDTVITADGLLGQITSVGDNWAKVSIIINSESSAGVRISRNNEIGIVEGDAALSKAYKCKLAYLSANASVIAGDILKTSGLGGIFPPDLMVGKITDIRKDNMGRLDYAVIEPFVDFNNLYEVLVITDWNMENVIVGENIENNTNTDEESVNEQEVTSVG